MFNDLNGFVLFKTQQEDGCFARSLNFHRSVLSVIHRYLLSVSQARITAAALAASCSAAACAKSFAGGGPSPKARRCASGIDAGLDPPSISRIVLGSPNTSTEEGLRFRLSKSKIIIASAAATPTAIHGFFPFIR